MSRHLGALCLIGTCLMVPVSSAARQMDQTAVSPSDRPGADAKLPPELDTPTVDSLLDHLRGHDWRMRAYAARWLRYASDERVIEPLIQALGDENASVRRAAARSLGETGDDRAVEPLVSRLLGEGLDHRETGAVAHALGKLNSERAVPGLLEAAKSTDPLKRRFAIRALGEIGSHDATRPLAIAMVDDRDRSVRIEASRALGEAKDPRAVEALVFVFGLRGVHYSEREAAAESLGRIGGREAIDALIGFLDRNDRFAQEHASRALAAIGDPAAVGPLLAVLENPEFSFPARSAAAVALGEMEHPRARDALLRALRSNDHHVRSRAATGLAERADPSTIAYLLYALHDTDDDVASRAAAALAHIGPAAVEPLVGMLSEESIVVRGWAAKALGGIGDERSEQVLRGLATDESEHEMVRRAASGALEAIERQRALQRETEPARGASSAGSD